MKRTDYKTAKRLVAQGWRVIASCGETYCGGFQTKARIVSPEHQGIDDGETVFAITWNCKQKLDANHAQS